MFDFLKKKVILFINFLVGLLEKFLGGKNNFGLDLDVFVELLWFNLNNFKNVGIG